MVRVCFVQLFHSFGRAYCIRAIMTCLFPKIFIYTHFNFMVMVLCIIACCSITPFTASSRKLCTYLHQHVLYGIPWKQALKQFHSKTMLSFFHRFCTSLKELRTAASLKMMLKSFQINAALPYVKGMYNMMPLHARIDCGFTQGKS